MDIVKMIMCNESLSRTHVKELATNFCHILLLRSQVQLTLLQFCVLEVNLHYIVAIQFEKLMCIHYRHYRVYLKCDVVQYCTALYTCCTP